MPDTFIYLFIHRKKELQVNRKNEDRSDNSSGGDCAFLPAAHSFWKCAPSGRYVSKSNREFYRWVRTLLDRRIDECIFITVINDWLREYGRMSKGRFTAFLLFQAVPLKIQ